MVIKYTKMAKNRDKHSTENKNMGSNANNGYIRYSDKSDKCKQIDV